MTKQELADSYVQRLRTGQAGVEEIADEIDRLVWSPSQTPLTQAEKLAIVDLMVGKTEGRVYLQKEADNKHFLKIVRELRRLLGS